MEKMDQYFKETSSSITGFLLIILGLLLYIFNNTIYFFVLDILIYLFLLVGIKDFLLYILKKGKKNSKDFFSSLLSLIFALFLSVFPNIPYSFLPWIVGIYFLFNGIFQLVDLGILIKNQGTGKLRKSFYCVLYFGGAIFLILYPLKNITIFLKLIGIYFILLGLHFLASAIHSMIPSHYKNRIKRKIRISLPVIIECLIPYVILNQINEILRVDSKKMIYEEKKKEENPDLEVIIHVSPNGFNRLGHVDIYFNGEIISYGNYDRTSSKFRELFGDGVIFITQKEKYIPFCIEHSNKTLFFFGLKLNEKQKQRIQKEIELIKKDLVRWYPPLELAERGVIKKEGEYKDYSSCLYQKTQAKFYKFTKGNFKTYFVLGNNCCLLADRIIGKSGIDLLKMNGFITPGTYYEYLNREFMRKGSFVVSRNIYNEKRRNIQNEGKYHQSKGK